MCAKVSHKFRSLLFPGFIQFCSHQSGRFHTCYGMGLQCPFSMYFFHRAPPSNGTGLLLEYLIVHNYIDVIGPDRQTSWRDGTELLAALPTCLAFTRCCELSGNCREFLPCEQWRASSEQDNSFRTRGFCIRKCHICQLFPIVPQCWEQAAQGILKNETTHSSPQRKWASWGKQKWYEV